MQSNFHESLARDADIRSGSDRAFGLVMAAACCVIAGIGFWVGTSHWPYWTAAAIAFAVAAWLWPAVLGPLNRALVSLRPCLALGGQSAGDGTFVLRGCHPDRLAHALMPANARLGLDFDREATSYWLMRDKTRVAARPYDQAVLMSDVVSS